MTLRAGMADLILRLRSATSTDASDETINGVSYWSDDQLQDRLDRHSKIVRDVPLRDEPTQVGSAVSHLDFFIPKYAGTDFEQALTSGAFVILNNSWVVVSSALYTVDYNRNVITFASDYGASTLYLRARAFDFNRTASDIWLEKAAHRAELINWTAGTNKLNEDQEYQHCIQMSEQFLAQIGMQVTRFVRRDYA